MASGGQGATRLKTRIRGTESPRTEIGRTVKNSRKKEGAPEQKEHTKGKYRACVRRRTQRRDKKEEAKDVKRRGGSETGKADIPEQRED